MNKAYVFGSSLLNDDDFGEELNTKYENLSHDDKLAFWRGFFDSRGSIVRNMNTGHVGCIIKLSENGILLDKFSTFVGLPWLPYEKNCIMFQGTNCLEFLHLLYGDKDIEGGFNLNHQNYLDLLYCWQPYIKVMAPTCRFVKLLPDARPPSKTNVTDSGYDLHLIKFLKEENGVLFYDTGIAVQPPHGYYFELVPRSSMSKTGYMLANSVGIIDASYTGSLKVALIKIVKDAPDIELPARIVQIIPKQFNHVRMEEVEDLEITKRGDGGFGSSGR